MPQYRAAWRNPACGVTWMQLSGDITESRIPFRQSLTTLAGARRDSDIVVTNMGSSRVWPLIENHPLDFHFNPSTMGGGIPLAMGIALAQPQRHVITLSGDGSLLMSMGSLVSVIAAECNNLSIILMDNGVYDVTGGQKTAASDSNVNFDDLARSIGFQNVAAFCDSESWQAGATKFLESDGAGFCWLRVEPAEPDDMKTRQEPMPLQLDRIRRELAKS